MQLRHRYVFFSTNLYIFQFTEHGVHGLPGHHVVLVVALGLLIEQEHVIIHARLCWEIIVLVNLRNMACAALNHVQVKQL